MQIDPTFARRIGPSSGKEEYWKGPFQTSRFKGQVFAPSKLTKPCQVCGRQCCRSCCRARCPGPQSAGGQVRQSSRSSCPAVRLAGCRRSANRSSFRRRRRSMPRVAAAAASSHSNESGNCSRVVRRTVQRLPPRRSPFQRTACWSSRFFHDRRCRLRWCSASASVSWGNWPRRNASPHGSSVRHVCHVAM